MLPAPLDKTSLDAIKRETEELEHLAKSTLAQGDRTLSELREIKERLAKLEEQIAALKRSLLLRDLGG